MSASPELVARLTRIPLFRHIDPESLEVLSRHLHFLDLADGQAAFQEGDPGQALFAIEAGSVVIAKRIDPDEERFKTLAILPAGAFFGEGGLIDGEPRGATARARGPTRLIRLEREGFLEVLRAAPMSAIQVLFGITRILNARLRQTSHELVTLFDTGRIAGEGLALDQLLEEIAERAAESTQSGRCLLFLLNPYTQQLELGHARGEAPAPPYDMASGLFGRVLGEKRPVVVNAGQAAPFEREGCEPAGLVACAIKHDGLPSGLIVIGDREAGARYTGGHLHLLQGIALQVGAAIENARAKAEEAAAEAHNRHYVTF